MATWINEVSTSAGGNISLTIQGGYGSVSRNGSWISFSYGVRAKNAGSSWTYNNIAAFVGGGTYTMFNSGSGSYHTVKDTWYYPGSETPWSYGGSAGSTAAGSVYLEVGLGWNAWSPSWNYTYSFSVPYGAASTYTVSYNANGGSGAPSAQTKYQGYTLTLSSTIPTRTGFKFLGWATSSTGSVVYSAGSSYTADIGATLYAKWEATNPIFTAPNLTATENSISYAAFTINTASKVEYQVNSGSWNQISASTTSVSAGTISSGISPGTSYTVNFRATNTSGGAATTHGNSVTTYSWPYITSISKSTVDVGATQTVNLYNPLKRSVSITAATANYNTSATTTSTSVNITIPTSMGNDTSKNSTHTATITYTSNYSSHTSSTTGTVNLPSSVGAPSINTSKTSSFVTTNDAGTFTLNGTSYAMSNATGSTSKYLQTKSVLGYKLVSANNPFSAQYGASISSYKVQINSKTATATTLGTQYYEGTSGGVTALSSAVAMTATTTYKLTISATDNRGFTSSYSWNLTTYPYSSPSVNPPIVTRIGGYGEKVTASISGSWAASMTGIHLAKTIVLKYSEGVVSTPSTSITLYSDTGGSTAFKSLTGTYNLAPSFSSSKTYTMQVVATDCFGNSATSTVGYLAPGQPILMIDSQQVGVGINCLPDGSGLYANNMVVTNQLRGGKGGTWIKSRDNATVKSIYSSQTAGSSSYNPVASVKTPSGEWSIGNLSTNESLYFSYTTDANYSAGTNAHTDISLTSDGRFSNVPRITNGTGSPSGGSNGDIYIQYS